MCLLNSKLSGSSPTDYKVLCFTVTVFCGTSQVNCEEILVTVFLVSATKRFLIRKQNPEATENVAPI